MRNELPPVGHEGAVATDAGDFSAKQFSSEPRRCFGDVFPLPVPAETGYSGPVGELRSRRSRQRVSRRRHSFWDEVDTVSALNILAGFVNRAAWPGSPINQAQFSVLSRVRTAHQSRPGPPESESSQAALRQLLAKRAGYSVGPGALASFVRERVSLPRGQGEPAQITELLPPEERSRVENFRTEMLLSSKEAAGVIESGRGGECHLDPVLAHNPEAYHQFTHDLYACNLIGFTDKPKIQVGLFVVTKKGEKQRLIVDARPTNRFFRAPPATLLGSVEAWGKLEVQEEEFFVAQEDVRDDLGEYFSLPEVQAEMISKEMGSLPLEAQRIFDKGNRIYPHFRVLPMGFSWAFHLAHEAHVHLARQALPGVPVATDRRPPPVLSAEAGSDSAMMIYADNNNHIGVKSESVACEQKAMMDRLHEHGLATHDITEASGIAESLGVRVDGLSGRITATPARDWRLFRALRALETRPIISGEELQVVLGHMTMRSMLNRSLLSILRHSCVFVAQCYTRRTRLWSSVAHEMFLFRSLMVLGEANVMAKWSSDLFCTDASLSGYAVMNRRYQQVLPVSVRGFDERWRFKRTAGSRVAPRATALEGLDVFEDVETVLPGVSGEVQGVDEVSSGFPEVAHEVLDPSQWHCLWAAPMHFREPIHQIEARSVRSLVKHLAKDRHYHNKRVAVFNDNMGVVLAVSKGRCASYGLLRLLRRLSAHTLATGIRLHLRWVPSELNSADADSRRWEPARHKWEGQKAGKDACGGVWEERSETSKWSLPSSGRADGEHRESKEDAFPIGEPGKEAPSGAAWRTPENGGQSQEKAREGHAQEEEVCQENAGDQRRKVHPRAEQRERASEARLLQAAGKVLRIRRPLRAGHREREGAGRSAVRVRGCSLHGRGGLQLRAKTVGGSGVRDARVAPGGSSEVATVSPSFEGLAQAGASPDSFTTSRVPKKLNIWSDDFLEAEGNGALQRVHFFDIRQARRVTSTHGCRRGAWEPGLRSHSGDPEPRRKRRIVEGRGLRRDHNLGRYPSRLAATVWKHECQEHLDVH